MKRISFIILLLLFIFYLFNIVFGKEDMKENTKEDTTNSVLKSARKAGFEKPAVASCPSCKDKIVVDLSVKTSQCPYCKEIFLSESAVERIANKQTLPYRTDKEKLSPLEAKWGHLRKGMAESQVREILGEPLETEIKKNRVLFIYPNEGYVSFVYNEEKGENCIDVWSKPYFND